MARCLLENQPVGRVRNEKNQNTIRRCCCFVASFVSAQAEKLTWGVRAGVFGDNADPFIGGEAIIPLTDRIFFNPNVEALFSDEDGNRVIANADAHYDFNSPPDRFIWAGAGLAA